MSVILKIYRSWVINDELYEHIQIITHGTHTSNKQGKTKGKPRRTAYHQGGEDPNQRRALRP